MKDIGWWKKRRIRKKAYKDVDKGRVYRAAPDTDETAMMLQDPDDAVRIHSTLDAAYFGDELSAFENFRDNALFQKKVKIWVYDDHGTRKNRRAPLMTGLAEIDGVIAAYKGRIEKTSIDSKQKLEDLDRKHKEHLAKKEDHLVQMCINHAAEVRSNFAAQTQQWYETVTALYAQKVLLLTNAKKISLAVRAQHFRNIRYYCACACERNPSLGPAYMTDEDMRLRADISLLGEYEEQLTEAIDQRDHYQEEYDEVQSWK